MNFAFSGLSAFFFFAVFDAQYHFDIHDLVEMAQDALQFLNHMVVQGLRDFEVVTADG
jgi:hypothetical protein